MEITFKAEAPASLGTKKKGGAPVTKAELKYWLYYAKITDAVSDATTAADVITAVGASTDATDKDKGRIEALAANLAAGFRLDGLTAETKYRYTVVVIHPDGTTNSKPAPAKTSEPVRLADSKATEVDNVPTPTLTANAKDSFTVTWLDADVTTAKKDDGEPLLTGDVSYVVYYTSVTTNPTAEEVKTAGSENTPTSGNVPVDKGATKTAASSGKAFVHTVYIVVEAINTTDTSKTKLSEVTEYAVTGAQTTPTAPTVAVTPGKTKLTVQVTPLTEGNFGTIDNGTHLDAGKVTYIFFYAKKGVDVGSKKAEAATANELVTELKGLADDGSGNTANKGKVALTTAEGIGTPKEVTALTPYSDYYYTVRVQETGDETNGVNTEKRKATTLALISPIAFTLPESDYNDGSIRGTSAVVTLSEGSFKAKGNEVWTLPLPLPDPTTSTDLPIDLTPMVKRLSPTKVQILFTGTATNHATANNAQGVKLNLKNLVAGSDVPDIFVTLGFEFIDALPDPINIYNARELQKVNDHPTLSFVLANDIDLTDVPWTPIGRAADKEYSGTFDGKGKTISNLKIGSKESSAGNYTGLFGKTDGATIKNLHIDHAGIWGNDNTGALVGYIKDAGENTTITDVSMKSTKGAAVTGSNSVGGLVGQSIGGVVSGYATGAVSGNDNVGGLVGQSIGGGVRGYATGAVSGGTMNNNVGGLVGSVYESIVNGYATGHVYGASEIGGLVGQSIGGVVSGYATGAVSGNDNVGGLVGSVSKGPMSGYARGIVNYRGIPLNDSDVVPIGLLGNKNDDGSGTTTASGFHSATESEFSGILKKQATGVHGTAVDISKVTDKNYQATFPGFTFGTAVGEWTWVADGQWPAINLPSTVGGASAPKDQPTGTK